ncbi:CARDB domain-containing protein [Allochromatium palmeri]|uniref:CARDB domain-containing protein n=1 Tax=Allochromatium palmeri TaxID=231048 RepID=UPI00164362D8
MLLLVLGWPLVVPATGTFVSTTNQESPFVEPPGTWEGGASDQDRDWDEPSWPDQRPIKEPGRVDTFTAPGVGLHPATLERLRAGRDIELIVEYVSPNLPANADATTIRRGQRLNKADVLHEMQVFDVEEVQDYSHMPMNVLRVRSLEAIEALRHDPRVKSVHEVGFKSLQLNQSLPLIDQPAAYGLGATGSGTTVAVLDTGVDYSRSAFGSCSTPGGSCKVVYARDFPADDGSRDDDGHGTNVAGIVLGVAPQARIAALDVFRADGRASDSDIIAALNWSVANRSTYNIVAVNLSLGDGQRYTGSCGGGSYDTAFSSLRSAGIFIAVASGNESYTNGITSPACVPGAVSVGAVYDSNVGSISWRSCTDSFTAADKVTCFSNSASFLSLLAPGALIDAAGLQQGGTSQASPHVAGAAAALKSACSPATSSDILSALQNSGQSVTDSRNGITKPRIDVAAAVRRLTSTIDCGGGGGTLKPDLIVSAISSPTSGTAGSRITASSTVRNQGTVAAGAFRLGYYLSTDRTITTSDIDTNWGCDVDLLALGASHNCSGEVEIPATLATGTYYLGAYADKKGQVSESNENNNALATSNTIYITGVGGSHALSVSKSGSGTVISSPAGIDCGSTCSASFTSNQTVTLTAVPSLGYSFTGWGGACSGTGSCQVTMNAHKSVMAGFTAVVSRGPDLVVSTVSSPATGMAGGRIATSATVVNQGYTTAGDFLFVYYLSTDRTITASDTYLYWGCEVSSLAPEASFTCHGDLPLPDTLTTGNYYLGAYADKNSDVSEGNESNNGLAASNSLYLTGTGGGQYQAEHYYRKVNAYFYGTFGRSATSDELSRWGTVLRDNNGSAWKPMGEGLQHYLSNLMGWGAGPLDVYTAGSIVDQVLTNLFGWSWEIDRQIMNYYVEALVEGYIRPRGLVNAILNDLVIMPRADGIYSQPNGWTGGVSIQGLLTSDQFARYRERIESTGL